uniref:hypothetical protein n=1 Tax=Streptosporangium sp. CA-235898 TaxID=3240073 RepID=UPI003F498263
MITTTEQKPIKSIAFNGINGTESEPPYASDPARHYTWKVVRYHNSAVPIAQDEDAAYTAYTEAKAEADTAWDALSSTETSRWMAAHHRWVVAETKLEGAARAWEQAYREFDALWMGNLFGETSSDVYDQILRASNVRDLRSVNRPGYYNLVSDASETRRDREEITKKTLKHLPR